MKKPELFPAQFDTYNDYQVALKTYDSIKPGFLYHAKSSAKEWILIPTLFTNRRVYTIMLATDSKYYREKITQDPDRWRSFTCKYKIFQVYWEEITWSDLALYVPLPFQSPLYESILSGVTPPRLPLFLSKRKDVILRGVTND